MIETAGRCEWDRGLPSANAHLHGVDAAISLWRRKRQAVFVADELRDLGVRGIEFLFTDGEVGAAPSRFGHPPQQLIRSFELQGRLGRICCRRFLFAGRLGILQAAHERNGEEAHFADLELLEQQRGFIQRGCVHARGQQNDGLLALGIAEPLQHFRNTCR